MLRYNKICKVEPNFNEYSPDIGQFSQVIWKDTDFIGLGRSTRDKGDLMCTYIVARYSPQATKSGFAENVRQGAFNDEETCPKNCKPVHAPHKPPVPLQTPPSPALTNTKEDTSNTFTKEDATSSSTREGLLIFLMLFNQ